MIQPQEVKKEFEEHKDIKEIMEGGSILRPYFFFMKVTVVISCVIPFIVLAYNFRLRYYGLEASEWGALGVKLGSLVAVTALACAAFLILPRRFAEAIDALASEQREYLKSFPPHLADWGILLSAGLSLLLELAVIRWQSAIFELFAFYKNFSLLACFLGLGLGYALSGRRQIPLLLTVPLLAWQMVLFIMTRYGPWGWSPSVLQVMPVVEQLHMGLSITTGYRYGPVLLLLVVTFVLTALAFVPVGQVCGCLMDQRPRLRAYGLNLLGSLAGVVLMFALSTQWTPPAVWFGACFAAILAFQAFDPRPLLFGLICSLLGIIVLAWPATFLWEQVHSPYQLLERGPGNHGLTTIRAAGHYYQRSHDFSKANDDMRRTSAYYALPYKVHPELSRVAVVGAGTGNDVAMALRMGARHVDAIEIDPAILAIGTEFHPNQPYKDPRVRPIVNDARSFLRTTPERYDLIVYGLLDSHTLLSHGSAVRLDSFVYTVEAFREARSRLVEGGTLSLAFTVLSPDLGHKIYLMLQEAFDGKPPVCVRGFYDRAIVFLHREGSPVELPPTLLQESGIENVTAEFADTGLRADMSTDDWPFFYMPRRVYPASYLVVMGLILLVSLALVTPFMSARPQPDHAPFFLLGAGFMLVETKSITELGLTFGNTWQVIGVVIAGILVMAFIANSVVQWLRLTKLVAPYLLLLASLAVGLFVMGGGGFEPTLAGRLSVVVMLTCPLFFSGMVFSTLLQQGKNASGAMAANLVGAICGGLLEYNSMYFGFLFLYWVALAIYAAAFLLSVLRPHTA
jgi:hypothetical protein